jgi:excisionase family DNA binding protein
VLTVKVVAERLALSVSKVYQLIEVGDLAHYRLGGAIRVSDEQLTEYLQGTERKPGRPQSKPGSRPRLKHLTL